MCTVTYVPASQGFILTHNRDEAPTRSPLEITRETNPHRTLLFPRDTKAGGTWITTDDRHATACLLNGAFVKHHHRPPYRRSRGLLLLDCMNTENPSGFLASYDYSGIEPFTLLLFANGLVEEIRWDEQQYYSKILPADEPHFWCSSTLYPPDMQVIREQIFREWLASGREEIHSESLFNLHRTGSVNDPENDYVMNRQDRVRTVSITQVTKTRGESVMQYVDLLHNRQDVRSITFREEMNVPGV